MTFDRWNPPPGRKALVAGAARSGVAAARLLARHGADVTLCDRRATDALSEATRALAADGVTVTGGRDDAGLLDGRDLLVWSPGIPVDHALIVAARERGIPVMGELELGFLAAKAPLLCITGTNGKSTTTDLTGALLRAAGREVEVCGNIGRAICEVAEDVSDSGLLVVEVSSFQLETVEKLKPWVSTWLNLTPDHLDRHGDLETYAAMKDRLFVRQDESDWAVRNADDPAVASRRAGHGAPLEFSPTRPVPEGAYFEDGHLVTAWRGGRERLMPRSEVRLPGPHNLANVLAALTTVMPLELPPEVLRATLREYGGLEHRLEPAGSVGGVRFVNDSKATNTNSLEVALQSFPEKIVLIAGGRDKGQDFSPLAPLVRQACRQVVLIGEGAPAMEQAWTGVPAVRAESLREAVEMAYLAARPDGVVLLSPGCSSYDMFKDLEDRGRRFKDEVARLAQGGART
ncbi:MAG: UDP-N-acetylmuramoyl-L-alanine--D-glutamate ligase [Candidatus Eisenbacteria bacterium]|uniref:UDP-N-acetylmuramoylalanine--D-glutamate ligase n=1 Tax=Eiseniibacteriota bacterium TaxID=2212470 RepID=A0A933SEA8_UNCEI|nr:UDP-N-acetylmuramoyl-L-alanine--D-glutamate ligase [Candidatus Eisenbacteria bacterium]